MAREGIERRLTTILAADVVGYSRLMAGDEAGTFAQLKTHRSAVIEPKAAAHGGRVVKLTGDGTLMEFTSVVDAVNFAVEVQQAMAERNGGVAEDQQIRYRIGINIGDIIVDGDDIYGDGVNIAARLEGLAEPGGICITAKVHEEVRNKLSIAFEDLGAQRVKNIPEPVHVYRIADAGGPTVRDAANPALPDKPSIAVLPFTNMSGDPEQEYFSDGITEDIITELSRFSSLFVIARNSSFTFKGEAVDVSEVGRKLGVQYVVEGSVRKAGNRVRITVQLIEAGSGSHLWAERYDRELEDIFAVQDEVVRIVTSTLVGKVESDRLHRTESLNSNELAAYDNVLRARDHLWSYTSTGIRAATELLEKAVAVNPSYADAHALLAMSHAWAFEGWWAEEPESSLELAFEVANRAVRLDSNSGQAQSALAYAYLYKRQHDQAIHHFTRASALLPCDSSIMLNRGNCLTFSGDCDAGLEIIATGERCDPTSLQSGPWLRGMAQYSVRRYQDAITALREMPDPPVEVHGWRTACHAQLGQPEKARAALSDFEAQAREDFSTFPGDTPGAWARYWWCMAPYRDDADLEHLFEGLRKAGLEM